MTKHGLILFTSAMVALTTFGSPVFSQSNNDMTAEEMTERFSAQKTRGLVVAVPANENATETDAAAQETVAATVAPTAELNTDIVPKDEQVNLNVSFDFDSAALRSDQLPKLVELCSALKAADVQQIRILGHTDASGSAEYNERLSKLRAEEVKRFLVTDCGFPEDRMEALGVGERNLFDPADPNADKNRRVEFQALG
ncbi:MULTISPECIES: OmpA family protein [Falsihalocynthiibacter]|uniref:OmpA family protein n=1 Tax=Falsihalocynthiibacter TaxID=2854182 RepID=UPI0030016643